MRQLSTERPYFADNGRFFTVGARNRWSGYGKMVSMHVNLKAVDMIKVQTAGLCAVVWLLSACSTVEPWRRAGETLRLTEPHCLQQHKGSVHMLPGACTSINIDGFVSLPRGTCVRLERTHLHYSQFAGTPPDYTVAAAGTRARVAGHWLPGADGAPKLMEPASCQPD